MSDFSSTDEYLLELRGVTLADRRSVSFKARRGDMLAATAACSELFDIASGLIAPSQGSVLFEGTEWTALDPFAECRLRSDIGRTFPQEKAWVENLSLRLNIGLRTLHSGRLSPIEAKAQIDDLAGIFGVSSFLDTRPEGVAASVLTRCQWIRAFIGNPALLLLEAPESGVTKEQSQLLRSRVAEYIRGGGAVLWEDATGGCKPKDFGVKEIRYILDAERNCGEEE